MSTAGVVKTAHNADTFKPYDPSETFGDVNPTVPKGKNGKCGVFGQILLAVIAVAVTALIPGGGFIGGAISAAIGSTVSQVVGVATGIQEKFSFKGVALAAISGGVNGGIGSTFGAAQTAVGAGVRAAAGNAISQGIGVATGLQDKFSLVSVAAAGVGAFAGHHASNLFDNGPVLKKAVDANGITEKTPFGAVKYGVISGSQSVGNKIGQLSASAIANAATRSAIEGSSFGDNIVAALPDVVAQAIAAAAFTECFTAETLIHTENGLKRIDQINVGDQVLSRHDSFGSERVRYSSVVQTFRSETRETLLVKLRNQHGLVEEIRTTPEHHFAREIFKETETAQDSVLVRQSTLIWAPAKSLKSGDYLTDTKGNLREVIGTVRDGQLHTVYNFEVAGDHTYFVGKTGIWVHNKSDPVEEKSVPTPRLKPGAPDLADSESVVSLGSDFTSRQLLSTLEVLALENTRFIRTANIGDDGTFAFLDTPLDNISQIFNERPVSVSRFRDDDGTLRIVLGVAPDGGIGVVPVGQKLNVNGGSTGLVGNVLTADKRDFLLNGLIVSGDVGISGGSINFTNKGLKLGNTPQRPAAITPSTGKSRVKTITAKSLNEQADIISDAIPGLEKAQAEALLVAANQRNVGVVLGGSRVRNHFLAEKILNLQVI